MGTRRSTRCETASLARSLNQGWLLAVFSVQIVDHCRHADAILCVTPYVGQFAVSKHTDIAPYVFIKGRADVLGKGKIGDLLNNTNATHLELNRCGVTDADLAKLKEFKNLRHLHLCGNKITSFLGMCL